MIEINKYSEIIISQGDDIAISVVLTGDTDKVKHLVFAVETLEGETLVEKLFPVGGQIILNHEDTMLSEGEYLYDVKAEYDNGYRYTLDARKKLKIIGVVGNG